MRISFAPMLLAFLTAFASVAPSFAQDAEQQDFDPDQLVGAWKLVSGEARGKEMARDSTGGIFVFTKDTLTGKSRFGEEKSWMSYSLDTTQKPARMKLTITKGFVGAMTNAIVQITDGKLQLCYGANPTSFTTKDGENNRAMVFVRSVDPAVAQKEVAEASAKKWNAIRNQELQGLINLALQSKLAWTAADGKPLQLQKNFLEFATAYNKPENKVDGVTVTEQQITVYTDTAVETGRAIATKQNVNEPIWDVWYTTTWVFDDGKWYIASEHETRVIQP